MGYKKTNLPENAAKHSSTLEHGNSLSWDLKSHPQTWKKLKWWVTGMKIFLKRQPFHLSLNKRKPPYQNAPVYLMHQSILSFNILQQNSPWLISSLPARGQRNLHLAVQIKKKLTYKLPHTLYFHEACWQINKLFILAKQDWDLPVTVGIA